MSPVLVTASATPPSRAWKSVSNLPFVTFSVSNSPTFALTVPLNGGRPAPIKLFWTNKSTKQFWFHRLRLKPAHKYRKGKIAKFLLFWQHFIVCGELIFSIGDVGLCFTDMYLPF